ncbi:hypothetical protein G6F68_018274 [Rhizopus microsporus]|nr:hypothetical protein G6F68_018274 [Rhizopus microsporus]
MKGDNESISESKRVFEQLASALDLKVLGWRSVPRDSTIIGPAARSKEPAIEQPFVVLADQSKPFDEPYFERQLGFMSVHFQTRILSTKVN